MVLLSKSILENYLMLLSEFDILNCWAVSLIYVDDGYIISSIKQDNYRNETFKLFNTFVIPELIYIKYGPMGKCIEL